MAEYNNLKLSLSTLKPGNDPVIFTVYVPPLEKVCVAFTSVVEVTTESAEPSPQDTEIFGCVPPTENKGKVYVCPAVTVKSKLKATAPPPPPELTNLLAILIIHNLSFILNLLH